MFREQLKRVSKANIIAIDTETTGINYDSCLVGVSIAISSNVGFYFPIKHEPDNTLFQVGDNENLTEEELSILADILADDTKEKIFHNIIFDYNALTRNGFTVKAKEFHDTQIISNLLSSEDKMSLDYLSQKYNCVNKKGSIKVLLKRYKEFSKIPVSEASQYSVKDTLLTFELYEKLIDELKSREKTYRWYRTIEMPLALLLVEITNAGIKLDTNKLKLFDEALSKKQEAIEKEISEMTEGSVNPNSPKQLSEFLYVKLHLPVPKTTNTGSPSTDKEALEMLAGSHPVIDKLLEYRELSKLRSTYTNALPSFIDSNSRIHSRFSLTATVSGRLSSSDPNLQNIPAHGTYGNEIRKCFVPKEGYKFIVADYSQIELRVGAFLSGEPLLYRAFMKNEDIHSQTARLLFSHLNPDEARFRAKAVNFGILFGMTAGGLAKRLKIPYDEARAIINNYFSKYQRIYHYTKEKVLEAETLGYVETLCGRRRNLQKYLSSSDKGYRNFGCRAAVNTPIQGTAAEIVKVAMLQVDEALKKNNIDGQIVLQVHDELVIEVNEKQVEETLVLVKENMTKFWKWIFPKRLADLIEVKIVASDSWEKD